MDLDQVFILLFPFIRYCFIVVIKAIYGLVCPILLASPLAEFITTHQVILVIIPADLPIYLEAG